MFTPMNWKAWYDVVRFALFRENLIFYEKRFFAQDNPFWGGYQSLAIGNVLFLRDIELSLLLAATALFAAIVHKRRFQLLLVDGFCQPPIASRWLLLALLLDLFWHGRLILLNPSCNLLECHAENQPTRPRYPPDPLLSNACNVSIICHFANFLSEIIPRRRPTEKIL